MSVIYRSPSQNRNEFDLFLSSLKIFLSEISKRKLSLSVATGDFNARFSYWLCKDIDTTEGLTSPSCIDLVFTDQPNLSINAGAHSKLQSICHHLTLHSGFNLNIYYPPPYQRLICDYKKADSTVNNRRW